MTDKGASIPMAEYKVYTRQNEERWKRVCNEDYRNITECKSTIIEEGYILPVCRMDDGLQGADVNYRGGVCDEQGRFVTGLLRKYYDLKMNYSIYDKYEVAENDIQKVDEEVIFGGMLFGHFGHCITESFSRLWFLAEDTSESKIVFLHDGDIPDFLWIFIDLLRIKRERITFLDKPARYKKIIVPDQAFVMFGGFHQKFAQVYDIMADNALKFEKGVGKKVYLSRTRFKKQDCFNEQYFEEFYRKRGYVTVYPECESIYKQIAILREAEEVVCTAGTMGHLILFAKEGTKLTLLLRENAPGAVKPQMICNQVKGIGCTIVDVSYTFLPGTHAWGTYLLGPTPAFREYVQEEGMHFLTDEERNMDWETNLYPYIVKWTSDHNHNNEAYKVINSMDIFDVVNRMSIIFYDMPLDRKNMPVFPKNHNIYVPKDIRLVDIRKSEHMPLKVYKAVLKQEMDNGYMIPQKLRSVVEGTEHYDLVQFEDGLHSFGFEDKIYRQLQYSTVDAVFYERSGKMGSIAERYMADYGKTSWELVNYILEKQSPDYYKESKWIFENNILYPYNTFIMKREVFVEFVTWLVPIMDMMECRLEEADMEMESRLMEYLLTLYFEADIRKYVCALKE